MSCGTVGVGGEALVWDTKSDDGAIYKGFCWQQADDNFGRATRAAIEKAEQKQKQQKRDKQTQQKQKQQKQKQEKTAVVMTLGDWNAVCTNARLVMEQCEGQLPFKEGPNCFLTCPIAGPKFKAKQLKKRKQAADQRKRAREAAAAAAGTPVVETVQSPAPTTATSASGAPSPAPAELVTPATTIATATATTTTTTTALTPVPALMGDEKENNLMKYKFWLAFDSEGQGEAEWYRGIAEELEPRSEKRRKIEGLLNGVQWMRSQGQRMKEQHELRREMRADHAGDQAASSSTCG